MMMKRKGGGKIGIMMRKLKGQTDKLGHCYVEMKGWMKNGAL